VLRDIRIDGIRMDSVENVATGISSATSRIARAPSGTSAGRRRAWARAATRAFWWWGEELSNRWTAHTGPARWALNDQFRALIRAALIGQTGDGLSFEDSGSARDRLPPALLQRRHAGHPTI